MDSAIQERKKLLSELKSKIEANKKDLFEYGHCCFPREYVNRAIANVILIDESGNVIKDRRQYINSFINDENIIIHIDKSLDSDFIATSGAIIYLFITNYARVLILCKVNNYLMHIIMSLDYWISTGYIGLIKCNIMHISTTPTNLVYTWRSIERLKIMLSEIKERVDNHRFIFTHMNKMISMNDALCIKYGMFMEQARKIAREELDAEYAKLEREKEEFARMRQNTNVIELR